MNEPSSCNCGGAYAWRQDRLTCVVCGVPYVPPPTAPRSGETATDSTLRGVQQRWDDWERERASLVDLRVQLNASLKDLAEKTDDARRRLHQADSRLHALDFRRGPLSKELEEARKVAGTDAAKAERDRVRAAEIASKRAAKVKPAPIDLRLAVTAAEAKPEPPANLLAVGPEPEKLFDVKPSEEEEAKPGKRKR